LELEIPESDDNQAKLLCADDEGAIIVKLQRAHYVLYHLSAAGELKCTTLGREKLQSYALGYDETMYLAEAVTARSRPSWSRLTEHKARRNCNKISQYDGNLLPAASTIRQDKI
jgi:hypothetical protein